MRCIGLTGGIATGKTTVAALLASRGATVVDADALAREVVARGEPALAQIVDRFGRDVLADDGDIDREALGRIVFADAERRRDLERITHPRVMTLIDERVAAARGQRGPVLVVDIPLLFELGLGDGLEGVMVVFAPPAVQLSRLMKRDGFTAAEAHDRIAAQMPVEHKRARASWVIDNGGAPEQTSRQVDLWWQQVVVADQGAPPP